MSEFNHIRLIVIAGPTGVGKTDLSIKLAHKFNAEIINGDSLQVYRGLDIGTGKITHQEKEGIPHHLLDILDPDQDYDASLFKASAHQAIVDIHQRGKLAILVGGTGLYLTGLLYDFSFGGKNSHDPTVRKALEEEASWLGPKAMWEKLSSLDPAAASKIPKENLRRTIRALEVIEVTGELFSAQSDTSNYQSVYNELLIVLNRDRQALYDRINKRVLLMDELGLEEEARKLYLQSKNQDWQSVKGIGYKEWWPYFKNQASRESTIDSIQQNSRRYAKRQLTWFRNKMKNPHWVQLDDYEQGVNQAIDLVEKHLKTN